VRAASSQACTKSCVTGLSQTTSSPASSAAAAYGQWVSFGVMIATASMPSGRCASALSISCTVP
jgi:hypothetical protein